MAAGPSDIYFYGKERQKKYFYLSNFYPAAFELDEKTWPTSEHYFQAMKFPEDAIQERIRQAPNPTRAKQIGRSRAFPLRADWNDVKEDVMRRALRAKFEQNPELRDQLMATHPATLVEDAPTDAYWGIGKDSNGKNRLGVLLMELRDQLREET
eukprot:gb/GECG01005862.1/.p1 GENE.gb/GECG01005862.1/~~gb/GECG01005862.1/.p1  ORF type:complete len:154 (+),score=19.53 gb/GECG01005862.1/:1-462(+)